MEPRLLRRGNVLTSGGTYYDSTWLQWSHAFSDVETDQDGFLIGVGMNQLQWSHAFSDVETGYSAGQVRSANCFNGATPSQTWKQHMEGACRLPSGASMEPRLLRRGNFNLVAASLATVEASMEPRLLRRGNAVHFALADIREGGFNGATPSQTWKRTSRFRGGEDEEASMEPRLLRRGNISPSLKVNLKNDGLQWSHAFSDVETDSAVGMAGPLMRFNGATPSQTWKPAADAHGTPPDLGASMEPRLLRRGNLQCFDENIAAILASMEPRLLRRGNAAGSRIGQRGVKASMEPRLLRRGNFCPGRRPCHPNRSFNGATPSQTWKPLIAAEIEKREAKASMEPRLLRRGNILRKDYLDEQRTGFNGATPSQTWKLRCQSKLFC